MHADGQADPADNLVLRPTGDQTVEGFQTGFRADNRNGQFDHRSIAEVFPDDEGVYRCRATNKHGTAECEAALTVGKVFSSF